MKRLILIAIIINAALCARRPVHTKEDPRKKAFISLEDHNGTSVFTYHAEIAHDWYPYVASAAFLDQIRSSGWSQLSVKSVEKYNGVYQAFWSGYLETNLTYDLTKAHWSNTFKLINETNDLSARLIIQAAKANLGFMIRNSIDGANDPFWYQIYLHLWQIRGVQAAFDGEFVSDPSRLNNDYLWKMADIAGGIYLLQLSGDIWTILRSVSLMVPDSKLKPLMNSNVGPSNTYLIQAGNLDINIGHNTGAPYSTMLRVAKRYEFPWKLTSQEGADTVPGKTIVFTSYPSVTFSSDDFYITNNKLVVSHTNIWIDDEKISKALLDGLADTVTTHVRIMMANRLATTAWEWIIKFNNRGSGTFNNEWLVFDAKLYEQGKSIPDGTLLLYAEVPGLTDHRDVTSFLRRGKYYAGANIPYLTSIYERAGLRQKEERYRDGFYSHASNPRMEMLSERAISAFNPERMIHHMRFNNYLHDYRSIIKGTSLHTATKAVSVRRDLNNQSISYADSNYGFDLSGGTDAKAVNIALIEKMEMKLVCGPTNVEISTPTFKWPKVTPEHWKDRLHKHEMQPDVFNFEPFDTKLGKLLDLFWS